MPCPIIDNQKFPDYLERVLKRIQVENDNNLKSCACQLATPAVDGCPIIFDSNKAGAFKGCLNRDDSLVYTVYDAFNTSETSITESKDSMAIWWLLKSIQFTSTWSIYINEWNQGSGVETVTIDKGTNGIGEEYLTIEPKKRVCLHHQRFFATPSENPAKSIYSSVWPFILNDESIALSLSFSCLYEQMVGSVGYLWVITTYPNDLVPVLFLDPMIYVDKDIQTLEIPSNNKNISGTLYGHSLFYNADWARTVDQDPNTFPYRSSTIKINSIKFWDV